MKTSSFFGRSELTRVLWSFRREFYMVGVFSMVANVLLLVPTLYMLQVFDRVLVSRSELTLLVISLITLFLFLVGAFSEWMRSRVLVRAGMRLDEVLSTRVFNASFELNLKQLGSGTAKAFADLMQVRQFLTGNGIFALFDAPWSLVYLTVVFFLHPVLGYLALFFVAVQIALVWFGHRRTLAPTERAQAAMSEESRSLQGKLQQLETLEPMGMVHNLGRTWQTRHRDVMQLQGSSQALTHKLMAWSKFLRYSQQSLALGCGALLVIDGQLSAGAMIAANLLMTRTLTPIDMLVGSWRGFVTSRAAFKRLESLLEAHPERDEALTHTPPTGALALRNLVATAPERAQPILKNLNLEVAQGSVLVVLGPSGSGKSTLARCMIGIWPYMTGEVLLDERPIAAWSRDELGPHLGYLPQDIELFAGSIAENIARFGEVDSTQVIEAARSAGLHDMILRFPKGYDTAIGEAGSMLSGGQRQRIGLARALYGKPKLVVLDEPNANLDDVGEIALVQAVQILKRQGSTVVLVTHRPGILAAADRVVILNNGVLQTDGTRDAVVATLREAQQVPLPAT
ncbi:type I secretion system permease/ATPase [Acidovorax sp. Be4]|uniref:Type I secretion system permease/ATPase n=1 Tax=Acidovorax bellezanensis TaxID=2976702 RepID=A0ABT2PIS0_9BURK|nr:type I secretion system permease/ATPase [Acidovorax sp. Be4]MCT9810387.1 type I secretion system permease/ATPase [Acidovorax sp. Be4]